ncbi:MAG: hypothetical protein ACI9LM_001353 [Alteromonadaceae bacterium]|jgi:hypothetical protein
MTKKKTLSAQQKGKLNAKKIQDWLKTDPTVPIYQGKINKTAICKMHDVPKSTIDTNQGLEDLFAEDGPIETLAAKQQEASIEPEKPVAGVQTVSENSTEMKTDALEQVKVLQSRLNSIILDLASEEFLISTGRYLPRLYDDESGSS